MNQNATGVPLLTYHGLAEGTLPNGLYTLSRLQFEAQMAYLAEKDFRSVSLEAVTEWLRGEPLPEKSIAITFDDGRESDFSMALPILKRYGFSATFFVNPGTLGREGCLTEEKVKEMQREGMEIGSHGYDHLFLTQLDEKDLQHQVVDSKKRLESFLQEEIRFFSIPRGRYNRRVLERVKQAGYRAACTSEIGFNQQGSDPFRLRRWVMKRPYTRDDFISVAQGRPKGSLVFDYLLKQSAHRLLGHRLYEAIRNSVLKEETR